MVAADPRIETGEIVVACLPKMLPPCALRPAIALRDSDSCGAPGPKCVIVGAGRQTSRPPDQTPLATAWTPRTRLFWHMRTALARYPARPGRPGRAGFRVSGGAGFRVCF